MGWIFVIYDLTYGVIGLLIMFMAYRLFTQGILKGGAQELTFGKWIKVKGGAPGIFFAIIGAAVIIHTATKERSYTKMLNSGEEINFTIGEKKRNAISADPSSILESAGTIEEDFAMSLEPPSDEDLVESSMLPEPDE